MRLHSIGGIAALVCAGTYLAGFALLTTLLAPLGYGTSEIDSLKVVAFIAVAPLVLIGWNLTIYVLNAFALAVLVIALSSRLRATAPNLSTIAQGFGLIWATLVLGAGMVGNLAVEQSALLATTDPQAAASLWTILHAVELGLGGGNEIAGGVWIGIVSLAALTTGFSRFAGGLGLLVALSGLATIVPALGDTAGAIFGLGSILWFILIGIALLRAAPGSQLSETQAVPAV